LGNNDLTAGSPRGEGYRIKNFDRKEHFTKIEDFGRQRLASGLDENQNNSGVRAKKKIPPYPRSEPKTPTFNIWGVEN